MGIRYNTFQENISNNIFYKGIYKGRFFEIIYYRRDRNGDIKMSDQNYQDFQDYNTEFQQEPMQSQNSGNGQKKDALAIVSLVLGIVSLVVCCCSGLFSVPFGIGGIICAVLSKKNGKSGMATAGLVCSIIGVVFGILSTILGVLMFVALLNDADAMEAFTSMYYYY